MSPEAKILARPILANAGLEADYQRKLKSLVRAMHKSVVYWLIAEYRRQESRIVMDESPATALENRLERVFRQWRGNFDDVSGRVARWFAASNEKYTKTAMMSALKDAGFTVKMTNSRRVNSITKAAISQNVGLIKSIGEDYFTRVQGTVMRSVMAGRDLGSLTKELNKDIYGVTARRAELIARDQTKKAMNAMTKARYEEMGITRAIWRHNAGGSKTYRNSHVEMDGKEFDLQQGLWDKAAGAYVQPGELPNCKCAYRVVLSAFGRAGE